MKAPLKDPHDCGEEAAIQAQPTGTTGQQALAELRLAIAELGAASTTFMRLMPSLRALRKVEKWLARPVRIAIIGEFNAGKSSLANVLLGIDSLPTSVVSNTCIPTLVGFAIEPSIVAIGHHDQKLPVSPDLAPRRGAIVRLEVGLPVDKLRRFQILDLPGLADPLYDGGSLDVIRQGADAVVWCTVATQAWKESERQSWAVLRPRFEDRSLLIVTFADLLPDGAARQEVAGRIRREAAHLFGGTAMISVSGAMALQKAEQVEAQPLDPDVAALRALDLVVERMIAAAERSRAARARQAASRIAANAVARMGLVACRA